MEKKPKTEFATFGAGCFWHVEETFRQISGVVSTAVGFMGGNVKNVSYQRVCEGDTGHAEVVHIEFDPKQVAYEKLLGVFWNSHNPTTLNRQGFDIGEQYRSVVFFHSEKQKEIAEQSKADLEKLKKFSRPIVTQIVPATEFFKAEEYHQKYLQKRGQSVCHV